MKLRTSWVKESSAVLSKSIQPQTQVVTTRVGALCEGRLWAKSPSRRRSRLLMMNLFFNGPTNAAGTPSHFACQICEKDDSVLTHGPYDFLRHFQGAHHFPRDQRLGFETSSWRGLDFEGNSILHDEFGRKRENILIISIMKRAITSSRRGCEAHANCQSSGSWGCLGTGKSAG